VFWTSFKFFKALQYLITREVIQIKQLLQIQGRLLRNSLFIVCALLKILFSRNFTLDYLSVIQKKTTPANTRTIASQWPFYCFRPFENFIFKEFYFGLPLGDPE
jgi:hypothetical protein